MLQSTTAQPQASQSPLSSASSDQAGQGEGASSGSEEGEQASSRLGKNGFLKILVTQLRNQNPRSPMKGREFATQLAQFSSVEQLTNISDQLGAQQGEKDALAQSVNNSVATNLIGRTVEVPGNTIEWSGEGSETIGMDLDAPAATVNVKIRDAAGNTVRTRTLENVSAGSKEIEWSGTNEDGETLPRGSYSFDVTATDSEGTAVPVSTYRRGVVDRVTFGEDETQLWVGGSQVPLNQIRSVATQ